MAIETWPIEQIRPYEGNPRVIPQIAVEKVAASIQEYGWRQPIVVDGNGVVLAGHTRLKAAQYLGLKEAPVHVARGLSPAQTRAYRLADNRVAEETHWDMGALATELRSLSDLELDLASVGFDPIELETKRPEVTPIAASDLKPLDHVGQKTCPTCGAKIK